MILLRFNKIGNFIRLIHNIVLVVGKIGGRNNTRNSDNFWKFANISVLGMGVMSYFGFITVNVKRLFSYFWMNSLWTFKMSSNLFHALGMFHSWQAHWRNAESLNFLDKHHLMNCKFKWMEDGSLRVYICRGFSQLKERFVSSLEVQTKRKSWFALRFLELGRIVADCLVVLWKGSLVPVTWFPNIYVRSYTNASRNFHVFLL